MQRLTTEWLLSTWGGRLTSKETEEDDCRRSDRRGEPCLCGIGCGGTSRPRAAGESFAVGACRLRAGRDGGDVRACGRIAEAALSLFARKGRSGFSRGRKPPVHKQLSMEPRRGDRKRPARTNLRDPVLSQTLTRLGEPDAGNPHVRFDERDVETEPWIGTRHRQASESRRQTATPRSCRHRATSRLYRIVRDHGEELRTGS